MTKRRRESGQRERAKTSQTSWAGTRSYRAGAHGCGPMPNMLSFAFHPRTEAGSGRG